ncbi:MAG: O-antigen ligase family protein [Kiritimatiellae bacterium]|nr:O-antigen ligase family protein [Kiritimatiellia bacterium]MDD5521826.1 O-antigen ligase family protein [Kiritimatiellia bacterium]
MMIVLLSLLIIYTSWMRGGSVHGYQPPIIWLSLLCLVFLLGQLTAGRKTEKDDKDVMSGARHSLSGLLKDPLFYIAGLFLVFLALQWYNSGRLLYFSQTDSAWCFSEPVIPFLPSSVLKKEAAEMFVWFLPAFTAALCIRHGLAGRSGIRTLLTVVIASAGFLGLFGVIQFLSGTKEVFWTWPQNSHFYASFSYQNHSGEFFLLMFCLSVGFLLRFLLFDKTAPRRRLWLVVFSLASLLTLVSVHLSLVAASTIFVWAVMAIGVVFASIIVFKRFPPVMRLNLIMAVVIFSCLTFYVVSGTAREKVASELSKMADATQLEKDFTTRWWQVVTARKIWNDNKLFGVGGWGYRHLVGTYMPEKAWVLLNVGRANVHNDFMQFLAEFGVVGLGLILLAVAVLFWPLFRYPMWNHPMILFPMLGVLLTCLHSAIDLPFRNAAVILSWTIILTAAGEYARLTVARRRE